MESSSFCFWHKLDEATSQWQFKLWTKSSHFPGGGCPAWTFTAARHELVASRQLDAFHIIFAQRFRCLTGNPVAPPAPLTTPHPGPSRHTPPSTHCFSSFVMFLHADILFYFQKVTTIIQSTWRNGPTCSVKAAHVTLFFYCFLIASHLDCRFYSLPQVVLPQVVPN